VAPQTNLAKLRPKTLSETLPPSLFPRGKRFSALDTISASGDSELQRASIVIEAKTSQSSIVTGGHTQRLPRHWLYRRMLAQAMSIRKDSGREKRSTSLGRAKIN